MYACALLELAVMLFMILYDGIGSAMLIERVNARSIDLSQINARPSPLHADSDCCCIDFSPSIWLGRRFTTWTRYELQNVTVQTFHCGQTMKRCQVALLIIPGHKALVSEYCSCVFCGTMVCSLTRGSSQVDCCSCRGCVKLYTLLISELRGQSSLVEWMIELRSLVHYSAGCGCFLFVLEDKAVDVLLGFGSLIPSTYVGVFCQEFMR